MGVLYRMVVGLYNYVESVMHIVDEQWSSYDTRILPCLCF